MCNFGVQKAREFAALSAMDEEVERDIARTKAQYTRNKDEVIRLLMEQVTSISLEVPLVVKGNFEDLK